MKRTFNAELEKRIPRNNFANCLTNAAQQFIIKKEKGTEILAGFPWFGRSGRSTFVSLPGLTLINGETATYKTIVDTMVSEMKGPLFPLFGSGANATYNSSDTSLWFFWALQQYADFTNDKKAVWREYGRKMKTILEGYRGGTEFNIHMDADGLIYAGLHGLALTWMDAVANGKPVTPRMGKTVEVNALWYNAICFSLELASSCGDTAFCEEWEATANLIPESFVATFWSPERRYLADYI
ncbi:MAG: amylo-alpha-1,6-glucosidase, partial [Bacteroidetes bacterium]|nr:amylo-alpha-1,6-glucosidase [Bacteroidota bacterium]